MMSDVIVEEMKRLHTAHERYGLASALARKVGVTPQSAREWLNGTTPPRDKHWAGIEAFFKLEPGHFSRVFVGDVSATPFAPADSDVKALLRELRNQVKAIDERLKAVESERPPVRRSRSARQPTL